MHSLITMPAMPRERIPTGSVGDVSVVPLGYLASDEAQTEAVIPRPLNDAGDRLDYPKTLKVGSSAKIPTLDGVEEWVVTRWRGLARAVDVDGKAHQIRRWRETKAAAKAATEAAGREKLVELGRERANHEAALAQGDVETTVSTLVDQYLASPKFARLASRTKINYRYAAAYVKDHSIGSTLPRDVDVAAVRSFLVDMAREHGAGGAKHARAVLRASLDLAIGVTALRVPVNPVVGASASIPAHKKRQTTIDHDRAPTDEEVNTLLSGLTRDPEARAMYPAAQRRQRSRAGHTGEVVNGKDVADLSAVMFATGARIGEVSALRWCDFNPERKTISISGTCTSVPGTGTIRQESTKTKGSTRVVPLAPWALAALNRRARRFGIDMTKPPESPIFGSPQFPDRWRDQANLARAVRDLYSRHGLDWARGHAARKWRVTSLAERGIPTHKIADLVGHDAIATTLGYLGRGRQTDEDVVAAL